jgi:hypothetical protein
MTLLRDERGSGAAAPLARRVRSGAVPARRNRRLSARYLRGVPDGSRRGTCAACLTALGAVPARRN